MRKLKNYENCLPYYSSLDSIPISWTAETSLASTLPQNTSIWNWAMESRFSKWVGRSVTFSLSYSPYNGKRSIEPLLTYLMNFFPQRSCLSPQLKFWHTTVFPKLACGKVKRDALVNDILSHSVPILPFLHISWLKLGTSWIFKSLKVHMLSSRERN